MSSVFISQHCITHNNKPLENLPPGSIFDFPDRVDALLQQISLLSPSTTHYSERLATDAELLTVHSRQYVSHLKTRSKSLAKQDKQHGLPTTAWEFLDLDETTILTAQSEAAARSAVGATLDAVDAVVGRGAWNAFVASRPPGHHNGCSESLELVEPKGHRYACHGGCILNETAVAVRHAQVCVCVCVCVCV